MSPGRVTSPGGPCCGFPGGVEGGQPACRLTDVKWWQMPGADVRSSSCMRLSQQTRGEAKTTSYKQPQKFFSLIMELFVFAPIILMCIYSAAIVCVWVCVSSTEISNASQNSTKKRKDTMSCVSECRGAMPHKDLSVYEPIWTYLFYSYKYIPYCTCILIWKGNIMCTFHH